MRLSPLSQSPIDKQKRGSEKKASRLTCLRKAPAPSLPSLFIFSPSPSQLEISAWQNLSENAVSVRERHVAQTHTHTRSSWWIVHAVPIHHPHTDTINLVRPQGENNKGPLQTEPSSYDYTSYHYWWHREKLRKWGCCLVSLLKCINFITSLGYKPPIDQLQKRKRKKADNN